MHRVVGKSMAQCEGELIVTRRFFENMGCDNARFNLRSFLVAGDHFGQQCQGHRWPYGPVMHIAPFNFPIEIPALQTVGALLAGNKILTKVDSKVALVMEQFVRLMLECGLPPQDLLLLHADGPNTEKMVRLLGDDLRMLQFTGSNNIAEHLCELVSGKIKVEDAGFDWKILGPDVPSKEEVEYVAYQIDQDAYASSGQKCSAQSIMFAHDNWLKAGVLKKLQARSETRSVENQTISPIITWSNERIQDHISKVLSIPGAKILFGGNPVDDLPLRPKEYGLFEPTAVVTFYFM